MFSCFKFRSLIFVSLTLLMVACKETPSPRNPGAENPTVQQPIRSGGESSTDRQSQNKKNPIIIKVTGKNLSSNTFLRGGNQFVVSVEFDQKIQLTGKALLELNFHPEAQLAECARLSEETVLECTYTVKGEDAFPLNYTSIKALNLVAGSSIFSGDLEANLTLPEVSSQDSLGAASIRVKGTLPRVTSIKPLVPNGPYGLGSVIPISVKYSEPIIAENDVVLSVQDFYFKTLPLSAKSGNNELIFNYVVTNTPAPYSDVLTGYSLRGTVKDEFGNRAEEVVRQSSVLNIFDTGTNIIADSFSPVIKSIQFPIQRDVLLKGEALEVDVEYHEPVIVSGVPTLKFSIDNASRVAQFFTQVSSTTLRFKYLIQNSETGVIKLDSNMVTDTPNASSITDLVGNSAKKNINFSIATKSIWTGNYVINQKDPSAGISLFPKALLHLPDVDGDGEDELIIAEGNSTVRVAREYTGSYLYSVAVPSDSYDFGRNLSLLGDVNNDGVLDFAVGDPYGGTYQEGRARVVSGKTGNTLFDIEQFACSIKNQFSGIVIGTRDYDGDGVRDIAYSFQNRCSNINYLMIRSGSTGGLLRTESLGYWGNSDSLLVAKINDVNNDGHDDFATYNADRDDKYRISVRDGQTLGELYSIESAGANLSSDYNPLKLVALGDINQNGTKDFVLVLRSGYIRSFDGSNGTVIGNTFNNDLLGASDAISINDLDNDGISEIGVVGQYSGISFRVYSGKTLSLLHSIARKSNYTYPDEPTITNAGDFFHDGKKNMHLGLPGIVGTYSNSPGIYKGIILTIGFP